MSDWKNTMSLTYSPSHIVDVVFIPEQPQNVQLSLWLYIALCTLRTWLHAPLSRTAHLQTRQHHSWFSTYWWGHFCMTPSGGSQLGKVMTAGAPRRYVTSSRPAPCDGTLAKSCWWRHQPSRQPNSATYCQWGIYHVACKFGNSKHNLWYIWHTLVLLSPWCHFVAWTLLSFLLCIWNKIAWKSSTACHKTQ